MKNQNSERIIYQICGLSPSIFGEAYVVVTALEKTPGIFRSEQFILTQRPTESLHMDAFEVNGNSFPAELAQVDIEFVLNEGKNHAETLVGNLLELRANELGRPEISLTQITLSDRKTSFVGCKMRGRFVKQFTEIKEVTKCSSFSLYLSLLDQVQTVTTP